MKVLKVIAFAAVLLGVQVVLSALLFPPSAGVALAAATLTTDVDEAQKVIFAEPLINSVVVESEVMDIFEESTEVKYDETTGGRYIEGAQLFALPGGVRAVLEDDYLPVARNPVFKNSRIYLAKIMGTVEMSGDTMDRVKHDEGAFLNYAEDALPLLVQRLNYSLDRQYVAYGAGVLGRVAGVPVGPDADGNYTLAIDRAYGVTGYEDPWLLFLEGQQIVFSANQNGVPLKNPGAAQMATVADLNEDASTLTLSMDAALAAAIAMDDRIFDGDAVGSAAGSRELTGLLGAVDDGDILATYQNIPRTGAGSTGNRLWRSVVVDGSAAPWNGQLTDELMVYADEQSHIRGGGKPSFILMSYSGSRGYWKSLKADRMFPDPKAYTGGKPKGLFVMLGDRIVPCRTSRKLPPQVAFGLSLEFFKRYHLGRWVWDDKTGSIWNRATDGVGRKDQFYATGKMYEQLSGTGPRKSWRLDGLARVA